MRNIEWAVYNAIKEKGELDQKELCSIVNDSLGYQALHYVSKATNCKNDERGDHCKPLLNIVRKINESPEVEKIIVIKNYHYSLGDEEQCKAYCEKLRSRAITMLRKAHAIKLKMDRNWQGKLISCQGKEITKGSKAREFVESYPHS